MGSLSGDLKRMGYRRTDKESPFADGAYMWSNGFELVCGETAMVIDGAPHSNGGDDARGREYFRYPNSKRVRMPGGFFGNYEWGRDEEGFYY